MTAWTIAAVAMVLGLVPCVLIALQRSIFDRLVAVEMSSLLTVLILALLAQGFSQPSFFDIGLTLALFSFPGGLVFIYFLERWL